MRSGLLLVLLLSTSALLSQTASSGSTNTGDGNRNQITVRGCVSRLNGDYVLIKENPGDTYEIQGQKLRAYLGKRVEVTGTESPSLSTSEDALTRAGNAAPETIAVKSITTLSDECQSR